MILLLRVSVLFLALCSTVFCADGENAREGSPAPTPTSNALQGLFLSTPQQVVTGTPATTAKIPSRPVSQVRLSFERAGSEILCSAFEPGTMPRKLLSDKTLKTPSRPRGTTSIPPKTSPWVGEVTPGGSHVRIKTVRNRPLTCDQDGSSDQTDSRKRGRGEPVPAIIMDPAVHQALRQDCKNFDSRFKDVEKALAQDIEGGATLDKFALHPVESQFWNSCLVNCSSRIATRMPYRTKLAVQKDRKSFSKKNKNTVCDHALSYEMLYWIFTNPETSVYRVEQTSELIFDNGARALIKHYALEIHYPVHLVFSKSTGSPLPENVFKHGETELGQRTAILVFSESRDSLKQKYAAADTVVYNENGQAMLFIDNTRYNFIFHACLAQSTANSDSRVKTPVRVQAIISQDFLSRDCIELIELPQEEKYDLVQPGALDYE